MMATYKKIQKWVGQKYGYSASTVKTCYIAHCKELAGMKLRRARNRKGDTRAIPCPEKFKEPIFEAFRHFNML